MSSTIILTDSTADIPPELADRLGIVVVPLTVMFGSTTYLDGIEMSAAQFYSELVRADELPTTSQPSPARFWRHTRHYWSNTLRARLSLSIYPRV